LRAKVLFAALLALVLVLVVAACGSSSDNNSTSTSGKSAGAIVSNPKNGKVTITAKPKAPTVFSGPIAAKM